MPFLPVYANSWTGASFFPEHGPGNAAGNSSSSGGYYPSASATFGEPMPVRVLFVQPEGPTNPQIRYSPTAATTTTTTTNSLPVAYPTYPLPSPGVYPTPNAQGGSGAVWQVLCRFDPAERDEVRVSIIVRRSPQA